MSGNRSRKPITLVSRRSELTDDKMPNAKGPKLSRVCGVKCRIHDGAPCIVAYSDAAHDKVASARGHLEKAISRRLGGPSQVTLTDAGHPHLHLHLYLLEDGTLLRHSWRKG